MCPEKGPGPRPFFFRHSCCHTALASPTSPSLRTLKGWWAVCGHGPLAMAAVSCRPPLLWVPQHHQPFPQQRPMAYSRKPPEEKKYRRKEHLPWLSLSLFRLGMTVHLAVQTVYNLAATLPCLSSEMYTEAQTTVLILILEIQRILGLIKMLFKAVVNCGWCHG